MNKFHWFLAGYFVSGFINGSITVKFLIFMGSVLAIAFPILLFIVWYFEIRKTRPLQDFFYNNWGV